MKHQTDHIIENSLLLRNPKQVFSDIDGEIVMLNIDKGEYYHLDNVAVEIWNYLSEPRTYKEIIDSLVEKYEVTVEKCKEDVNPFLNDLLYNHILELSE